MAVASRPDVDDAVAAAAAAATGLGGAVGFRAGRAAAGRSRTRSTTAPTDLARVLTKDQGKPLAAEARDEVAELAEYFRMAAEDAIRLAGWRTAVHLARTGAC